jgi:CHC2 zinc finger
VPSLAHSPGDRAALEAALLARGARKIGRHWRFTCPFHDDQHPSCDYHPIKHVFYCRACHRGGGWKALAERLGVMAVPGVPQVPVPGTRQPDLPESTAEVLDDLRRQRARLAPYDDLFAIADWIRQIRQRVAEVRQWAAAAGDREEVWPVLRHAAELETLASALEAELDEVMRHD